MEIWSFELCWAMGMYEKVVLTVISLDLEGSVDARDVYLVSLLFTVDSLESLSMRPTPVYTQTTDTYTLDT